MISDFAIMLVSSLAMLLIGLLVFIRNPAIKINQAFGALSASIILWTVFNYLSVALPTSIVATRSVFAAGILTALSLVNFLVIFPSQHKNSKTKLYRIHLITSIVLLPIVFMPQFISEVTQDEIITSHLYPVFVAYILFSLLLLPLVLGNQARHTQTSSEKSQIRFVALGVLLYAASAVISNVLLPLFVNNWSSSRFGPLFSFALIGMVAFSIVKHKLFDIRLIIARALGYVLTLSVLGGGYAITTLVVFAKLFDNSSADTAHIEAYAILAIIFGFTLNPLKRFFDELTKKLFYKDAYDTQAFLNEFNKTIVGNIDLKPLLTKSSVLIEQTIKAESCNFVIRSSGDDFKTIPSPTAPYEAFNPALLTELDSLEQKIIYFDNLHTSSNSIRQISTVANASIIGKLYESSTSTLPLGYLIMGRKKSGNPYNKQDLRVLEIITNELYIAVQNALRFEEIQQFNETLQHKIDVATKQLQHTNEKLKALDEAKDEFISMASHQLRTPLTSIKGYVSMVIDGDAGKITPKQEELLTSAFNSSQRMVYLIADLLNVSRLKTGKFLIEYGEVNLADVIEGEIQQLHDTAAAHNIKIEYKKPAKFPTVMLDDNKTRQVIMNFVDNAIYYTPKGGKIKIGLKADKNKIEFTVTDNGIGVPKEEQKNLFAKFYRAGNARKARPDGTGLGLFMAQKVIVAQNGAVIFKSTEGKGSTFGFTFPLNKIGLHNAAKLKKSSAPATSAATSPTEANQT